MLKKNFFITNVLKKRILIKRPESRHKVLSGKNANVDTTKLIK